MGFKKIAGRRAHNGIRLSKLPAAATDSTRSSPTPPDASPAAIQHVVSDLDAVFPYHEIPDELLVGSDLDLSHWSVVAQDSCIQKLADSSSSRQTTNHKTVSSSSFSVLVSAESPHRRPRSGARSSSPKRTSNQLADAVLVTGNVDIGRRVASPTRLPPQRLEIMSLNLAGAEHITDAAAFAIGDACPSLRHLVLERAAKLTDIGVRHIVSCCRQLQTLNLNYVTALQSAAVSTIGELQLPLQVLSLAGCTRVPAAALERVVHGCRTLEMLDVSGCNAAVSDTLLLALGQQCSALQQLVLRGCRDVSTAGVVAFANASANSKLKTLDLTRCELPYKLTDVALLALAERCSALETLVLTGCAMLTDVGISWLCDGCTALTHLDVSGCTKLTDVALRAVGDHLLLLRRLSVSHCVRVSDNGLRFVALGCSDLEHLDAVGLVLLADPRALSDSRTTTTGSEQQCDGVAALARHCRQLRHLDVSRCTALGDATLQTLAVESRALATLRVAGCRRVTSAGVNALLVHAQQLTALTLNDCNGVSDGAFSNLLRAASADAPTLSRPLEHLTRLELRGCAHVTDTTLTRIGSLSIALTHLDVSGCVRVSDVGLLALAESTATARALQTLRLRGLRAVTATGMSWLAATCCQLLLLDVTDCTGVATSSLHALAHHWRFATVVVSDSFRGVAPRHRATDWLALEAYSASWRAATLIQSLYRANVAKRRAAEQRAIKHKRMAATRMQRVYRGRQARKRAVVMQLQRRRENEAAQCIQRCVRQRQARFARRRIRAQQRIEHVHNAARVIQRAWRRKRLRDTLTTRLRKRLARNAWYAQAAICIECAWRSYCARVQLLQLRSANAAHACEQRDAAIKVQRLVRARAARRIVMQRRQQLRDSNVKRERAALCIQTHVRRRRAQRIVATRMLHAKRMHDAATRIQRHWRNTKRLVALQLVVAARQQRIEHAAVTRLQAAWKRKQGRRDAQLLRLVREQAQQHVVRAALTVQTHWRAKRARVQVAAARQRAIETLVREAKLQHRAAALVQAHYRGRRGRERYRELVLQRKYRWKRVEQHGTGQTFYYNKETGEVRFRRPQDVLDLLPKPLCDNCGVGQQVHQDGSPQVTHIAQIECKDCSEMFCNTCWLNVHAGGKRRRHEFRCLYDFDAKRVDYSDNEFPSKWPSEIEQDEKDGWALRMYPRRQAVEVRGAWERYVDAETGREWFYNKETESSSYSAPREFQVDSNTAAAATTAASDWTKRYDESSGAAYYYNNNTCESTFVRPIAFETARQALVSDAPSAAIRSARDSEWAKYVDPQSGCSYYYNSSTLESTFARPSSFQTARRGSVAIEAGGSDWAKYYDLTQGLYYYYNARTFESSFARPREFATPRVARGAAASAGMTEFYDPATAKAYFYNAQTTECQLAAAPSAIARMHDYR